jgi:hypothetical protein
MSAVDRRRAKKIILISLECGCRIKVRDAPFSPHAEFGCSNNMGHGYRLGWTQWVLDTGGYPKVNPKYQKGGS